jgi:hypothetical protein
MPPRITKMLPRMVTNCLLIPFLLNFLRILLRCIPNCLLIPFLFNFLRILLRCIPNCLLIPFLFNFLRILLDAYHFVAAPVTLEESQDQNYLGCFIR